MKEDEVKLSVKDVQLSFGGLSALDGINLDIKDDEILAIIGPNGAGKTSLLNCINGFYRPQKGDIFFEGKRITGLSPHKIAKLGISRAFQNIELFTGLSVVDNLMAARHIYMKQGLLSSFIYFGSAEKEEIRHRKVVEDIIELLEIEAIRKKVIATLPYGMRKRVELGRAIALEPKLLLLDEPMAGMNVDEKEDMARFIIDVFELKNIPIVLIEHDMEVVMDISDRVIVLDFGIKIAEGTPDEIKEDPKVIKAYLGDEEQEPI